MKYLSFFLLLLFLSSTSSVLASGTCPDSCGSSVFDPPSTATISLAGADTCEVRITYQTRKCGTSYDVRITAIEPLSDSCSQLTGEELIDLATTVFMFDNPMGFPSYSDTSKVWRVYRAACWYADTTGIIATPTGKYKPCTDGGCCVTTVGAILNNCDGLYFIPMTQKEEIACSGSCPGSINVCGHNPANRFTKPTDKW
ncbi:MAG: hypothetical protein IPM69_13090 [Ignavibacteria bacterium]|nr:hypothetical protein [Ignavibacteria bacterium]